jgi:GNAT superfamily N-acetyltransferase
VSEWTIDHYRPGDETGILQLFKEVFGEERSLALWRWRYGELPGTGESILVFKDKKGDICGHYAALPLAMSYRGKRVYGTLRLDFMVRPDMQGKGIGGLLIDAVRERARGRFVLAYAFPNTRSTKITRAKRPQFLGEAPIYWRLEDLGALLRGLGRTGVPPTLVACANAVMRAVYHLAALPDLRGKRYLHREDKLFEGNLGKQAHYRRERCDIYVIRDEPFLRWRFDRHPEMEYSVLFISHKEDGGDPMGYVVLAVRDYQGFRIGFIVDILVQPPGLRPVRYILAQATAWFRGRGVETISCLMTGRNPYTTALRSLGFVRVPHRFMPRDLNLTIRTFDPDIDKDHATDPDNWILTWADTDLV